MTMLKMTTEVTGEGTGNKQVGYDVPTAVVQLASLWRAKSPLAKRAAALPRSTGQCVEATRFGIEVLTAVGVEAKPLPCSLMVFNLAAQIELQQDRLIGEWPDEAWSAGVAANPTPKGKPWDAHLVIEWKADSGHTGILDLDLARYSRPMKKMAVYPVPVVSDAGEILSLIHI